MKGFLAPLQGLAEYEQICEKSKKNKGILQVSGCLESQKAHLIYGLGQTVSRRLILAEDERRARGEGLSRDLRTIPMNEGTYALLDLDEGYSGAVWSMHPMEIIWRLEDIIL